MRGPAPSWGLAALLAACSAQPAPPPTPAPRAPEAVIETVAGLDRAGYDGEGRPATATALDAPIAVAFEAGGRALIIDWNNQRVRAIDGDGALNTVLGTGEETYGPANVPATAFAVHHPLALAVTAGDEWLVAGYHDPRVLRVDGARRVRVVAGFGGFGDTGDGGAATLATLDAPAGVAVDAQGMTYVVDELHHRVRRVRADGVIEALIGDGTRGYSGDGGPAHEARLDGPTRIAVSATDGALYVCDTGNHAIRRVDAQGVITTVAGTGEAGFGGDGGPAIEAQLYRPFDVALLDDGGFLVADSDNARVRRVFPDGHIETVVGTGEAGFGGDGGPAREARLHTPWGVAVDAEGRLWIADTDNHRVRRVSAALLGEVRAR